MAIQRFFLSPEEFRQQNMTGAVVLSMAKFHELTVKQLTEKHFHQEVLDDHSQVAFALRKIAYKMDPSLKAKAQERKERRQQQQHERTERTSPSL